MLIYGQISFPLLKKLVHLGDPITNKAFKEEIAKRILNAFQPVLIYLIKQKYFDQEFDLSH